MAIIQVVFTNKLDIKMIKLTNIVVPVFSLS